VNGGDQRRVDLPVSLLQLGSIFLQCEALRGGLLPHLLLAQQQSRPNPRARRLDEYRIVLEAERVQAWQRDCIVIG